MLTTKGVRAMRRFALTLLLMLGLIAPAQAATLLNAPVTTAVTALVTPALQIRPGPGGQFFPATIALYANFAWGSAGTTADAWIQTSFDGGTTWCDVANFHFTTAIAKSILNVTSSKALVAIATAPCTDGTLAANTANDGVFGTMWRVKYTTTGTYAGGTVLRIDAITSGLTSTP